MYIGPLKIAKMLNYDYFSIIKKYIKNLIIGNKKKIRSIET